MLEIRIQHANKKLPHGSDNSVKSHAVHHKQSQYSAMFAYPLNKCDMYFNCTHRSVLLLPFDMFANYAFKLQNLYLNCMLADINFLAALMISKFVAAAKALFSTTTCHGF
jgi:hypothetical protein